MIIHSELNPYFVDPYFEQFEKKATDFFVV